MELALEGVKRRRSWYLIRWKRRRRSCSEQEVEMGAPSRSGGQGKICTFIYQSLPGGERLNVSERESEKRSNAELLIPDMSGAK